MLHQYIIPIKTDSSGDAEVYTPRLTTGRIVAVKYVPGDIDTNGDLVITGETTEVPILTKANAGTATVWFYPLAVSNKVADGSASSISEVPVHVYSERVKVVVDQGDANKTGSIAIWIDE